MTAARLIRPPRLRPGDRVAVVAPSGPIAPERMDCGLDILRGWDLDPVTSPGTRGSHDTLGYLAASDEDRARELQQAWCDPSVAAVFAARGGYGAQRMVDLLDWDALRAAAPKPLVGFSDVTVLHEAFAVRAGVSSLHGPAVAGEVFLKDEATREHLRRTLFAPETVRTLASGTARPLVPGRARGVTVGGCLAMLASEVGTAAGPARRPRRTAAPGGRGGAALPHRPGADAAVACRLARRRRRDRPRLLGPLRPVRTGAGGAQGPAGRSRGAGGGGVRLRSR